MAKDEQTEKATPQKIKDAREEGRTLKSKELNTLMSFIAFLIMTVFLAEQGMLIFLNLMKTGLQLIQTGIQPKELFIQLVVIGLPMIILMWLIVTILTFVSYGLQVGFLFSPKTIIPKFKNIDPSNYWKNLANVKKSGFELFKNLAMFAVMSAVIYNVFRANEVKIQAAMFSTWFDSVLIFNDILTEFVWKISIVFILLGIVDYFYQKYEYESSLKMKKQEVKDEHKNQQGSPETKHQQKMMMRKIMEKQVVKTVQDAQMVIVNPTHYAVVVRYKKKKGDAVPRVILKGVDDQALLIKELARKYNIPIVENKPLARRMYAEIKEEEYISKEMYEVIGKILAKLTRENKTKVDLLDE